MSFRDLFPVRVALRMVEAEQTDMVLGKGARNRGAVCELIPAALPGVGYQLLDGAGFDTAGMPGFFERLQKATRLYENNAPTYLRTHPLTTERIADMQDRVESLPSRLIPDGLDYRLVRAKLRAKFPHIFPPM